MVHGQTHIPDSRLALLIYQYSCRVFHHSELVELRFRSRFCSHVSTARTPFRRVGRGLQLAVYTDYQVKQWKTKQHLHQ